MLKREAQNNLITGFSRPARMERGDPPENPESLLSDDLYPRDLYKGTTYWADLPFCERLQWINAQSDAEARRELNILKSHLLESVIAYFRIYVVTGLGLFVEGYTLFSIGNIKSLFQDVWPACWETNQVCTINSVAAVEYLEIVGLIGGQLGVGFIGDWIGRRWGLIQDAVIMVIGTILLTAMWGRTLQGWVIMYGISIFLYGVGVGGEYPMTSTRAMESHGNALVDRMHRGRNVLLAFTMQGWGQLVNQAILIICLFIFNGGGNPPYGESSAQWTFRISFVFVFAITVYLLYHRIFQLKFADHHLKLSKRKHGVIGYDTHSLKLVMSHYWHRLLGTAGCWFCINFFFYGTKIFQSVFIKILDPNSTVIGGWNWNLLNVGCALVGYYMAAILVDHKLYGRVIMQAIGFLVIFILFVIPAAMYDTLTKPGTPIKVFQFLYFFSSFWSQFGPNSTTFLIAAEVYPAPVRATAHGFSAAVGKLGALVPAVIYNYTGNHEKFWIVTWFGLLGFVLTVFFVADTTGLDLREQERYWLCVRKGRQQDYHGIAIHPRHLSLYEMLVLRRHRYYDPQQDRQSKIIEFRAKYEESLSSESRSYEELKDFDHHISENTFMFFHTERQNARFPDNGKESAG